MIVVIVVILILLALVWGFNFHNQVSSDNLAQHGFQAEYTLNSSPQLQFDEDTHKWAVLGFQETTLYSYEQVQRWEWKITERGNNKERSEPDLRYQLILHLKDRPSVSVDLFNGAADQKQWEERLRRMFAPSNTPRS